VFRKLLLTFVAVWTAGLALMGVLLYRTTWERLLAAEERRLEAELDLAELGAPAGIGQEYLSELARRREVRFTRVAADGKVLADSSGDPAGMENHGSRPEIVQARVGGKGRDVRESGTLHEPMLYLARSVKGTILRAAVPLKAVRESAGQFRTMLLLSLAGAIPLGGGVAFFMVRRVILPLREIAFVADWIAAGDFSRKASRGSDEVGQVAQAINHMADELARRLESLQAERSRLETVLSTMAEGVISLDGSGRVLLANQAARVLLQLDREPAGLALCDLLRLPGLQEQIAGVIAGGPSLRRDVEIGPRTLSMRLSGVNAGKGAVLVAHDITEDRRYDELRKEFVANVSHEVRTPLTLIQGYVETLLEGAWRDEKEVQEFLSIIDRNVRRLSALVRDLLDLSRLESGGRPVSAAPLDLKRLAEEVAAAYQPLAQKRRQSLDVDAAGVAVLDGVLIERALSNLVENALKYTPEGGHVGILAGVSGGRVRIEVRDDGVGIPEEDQARIFERFYRVDKSRSRDLGGTGLGLSIVKHVAQVHGGGVSVRSAPGQGSTFVLDLPEGTKAA
jgi:two-component system phosphate regulon sensor histidine kinase PhoR